MKIVLIVVFILTACGLFLLLSGILKLPTLRTGRAMMQSGKKEKKLQKTLDAFYMDGAAYLGKYIGMNAYKKSRMQNVLNAAGLKMTPETYMAYAYLKAGSIFLLILPALHVFPLLAILLVLLGVMVYYKETRKAEELVREKREQIEGELYRFVSTITQELKTAGMYFPCWSIIRKMPGRCSRRNWTLCVPTCVPAAMRQHSPVSRQGSIPRSSPMWSVD